MDLGDPERDSLRDPERDSLRDPVRDHGGDLAAAEALFGTPAEPWLDLSTGINPWPWPWPAPLPMVSEAAWRRLPDTSASRLKAAAARRWGCPVAAVAAAPGSQALIQVLPRLRRPGRVAVVSPTYAEHARCWARLGHDVVARPDIGAIADWAEVVVVVNPNNPDGRVARPEDLLSLAQALAGRGGWLVVDEAFADLAPRASVAFAAGRPGLVVLRSFGKFHGLAGLRLGFALSEPAVAAAIEDELGPWAVPGPALEIGAAALADTGWDDATRARLEGAAAGLDRILARHGLEVLGGTALFRLVRHPDAGSIHAALGRSGILVRAFAAWPDRLRFGLPCDETAIARLERALSAPRG